MRPALAFSEEVDETIGAPEGNSFRKAFHERVKHWSYGRWFVVVFAVSVAVTAISALVRQL